MKKLLSIILLISIFLSCLSMFGCAPNIDNGGPDSTPQPTPYITIVSPTGSDPINVEFGGTPCVVVDVPDIDGWDVVYTSSKPQQFPVNEFGVVTMKAFPAKFTITASFTNGVDSVIASVNFYSYYQYNKRNYPVEAFYVGDPATGSNYDTIYDMNKVTNQWSIKLGKSHDLRPTVFFNGLGPFNDATIEVDIADKSVVTYSNGKLTPLKKGSTEVTITAEWRTITHTLYPKSAYLRRVVTLNVVD